VNDSLSHVSFKSLFTFAIAMVDAVCLFGLGNVAGAVTGLRLLNPSVSCCQAGRHDPRISGALGPRRPGPLFGLALRARPRSETSMITQVEGAASSSGRAIDHRRCPSLSAHFLRPLLISDHGRGLPWGWLKGCGHSFPVTNYAFDTYILFDLCNPTK